MKREVKDDCVTELKEFIEQYIETEGRLLLRPKGTDNSSKFNEERAFPRFCLDLALRTLNLPLLLEGEAFTDGPGDRGIDAVALAVGEIGLHEDTDIPAALSQPSGTGPRTAHAMSQ